MMHDFNNSSDSLSSLTVSIFVLGYVLGPLIVAPISELYGRVFVLFPAYLVFLVTLAVCAASTNLIEFLVIRVLMGFGAIAFLTVGPAVVADVVPREQRGRAVSVLTSGPAIVSFARLSPRKP